MKDDREGDVIQNILYVFKSIHITMYIGTYIYAVNKDA